MPLPQFNDLGDLPPGVHQATLDEVVGRFSGETARRDACTRRLIHVVDLARRTGHLQRLIVFEVQYWQIKRGGAKRGIVDVTI